MNVFISYYSYFHYGKLGGAPLADVLWAATVLVLESLHSKLVPAEAAGLHARQSGGGGVAPLWDEDDEGQGLTWALQEVLHHIGGLQSTGKSVYLARGLRWQQEFLTFRF